MTIVSHSAPTAQAPAPALPWAVAHLLTTWRRGVRVQAGHGTTWTVGVASRPHTVGVWQTGSTRYEYCDCERGRLVGIVESYNAGTTAHHTDGKRPCGHVLVLRWHRLDSFTQDTLIARYPALRVLHTPSIAPAPNNAREAA